MRAGGGNVAADMFRWEFGDRALLLECKVDGVTSFGTLELEAGAGVV